MGCNCGKAKEAFKNLVQKPVPVTPQPTPQPAQPPVYTRAELIKLRGIRMENRAKRIAARNDAILAAEQAKKNLGKQ